MNKLRKQSDTTYPLFFLMVDSTDHVTGKTGLSPTVTISKNGGSFASPSGAVSEVGNGLYKVAGNATDSNTVGELWIHATGTGADPTDTSYTIVAYDPFDSVRLGLTALPNAAAESAGGLYTRGTGAGQINQPANGQIDANTVKVSGTTQTARDLGASVLLSSGTGTGQLDFTSGVVKSNMTQIDGEATNGNNATLKLKVLDIRSDSTSVPSVSIVGKGNVNGQPGGTGMLIQGGGAGAAGGAGGKALYLYGGNGTTIAGRALYAVTDGAFPFGGTPVELVGSGTYPGLIVTSSSGYGIEVPQGISANITGTMTTVTNLTNAPTNGDLTATMKTSVNAEVDAALNTTIPGSPTAGSVNAILAAISAQASIRPAKNVGYSNFMFPMFDATTKNPKPGLTVTAERAIDGNPFSPCSNAVVELSNGVYRVSLSSSDLNGDKIMLRFSSSGADDQLIEIITQG